MICGPSPGPRAAWILGCSAGRGGLGWRERRVSLTAARRAPGAQVEPGWPDLGLCGLLKARFLCSSLGLLSSIA